MKTIGIIGMGNIGTSVSWILQQKGLTVIAFKKNRAEAEKFEGLIRAEKVKVINKTGIEIGTKTINVFSNVKVSCSLEEIAEQSDLILYCSLFPHNVADYLFKNSQIAIINRKKIPVLVFPGKLGSSWLIGNGKMKVGLVGYAPFFSTKDVDESNQEIFIYLNNIKSKIPLAYDNANTRLYLLNNLNRYFNFRKDSSTFVDGGHSLKTSLCSPISAINAAAICYIAEKLIQSEGKISMSIYALNEKYSLLFQKVFDEQIAVAKLLQFSNLLTITDWLKNRSGKILSNNVTDMLHESYKDKKVTLDKNDRRITESYYALLFFRFFAETLGIQVLGTKELLNDLSHLHTALNKASFLKKTSLFIQKSATLYAENVLKERKRKQNNKSPVLSYV